MAATKHQLNVYYSFEIFLCSGESQLHCRQHRDSHHAAHTLKTHTDSCTQAQKHYGADCDGRQNACTARVVLLLYWNKQNSTRLYYTTCRLHCNGAAHTHSIYIHTETWRRRRRRDQPHSAHRHSRVRKAQAAALHQYRQSVERELAAVFRATLETTSDDYSCVCVCV